jgi:sulfite reductase (NADPH) flavoprotein alpha-component
MAIRRFYSLAVSSLAAVVASWSLRHSHALSEMQQRGLLAAAVALAYLVFCCIVFLAHRRARQEQERSWAPAVPATATKCTSDAAPAADAQILVLFASQTGFAEQLALQTAQSLRDGHMDVRVLPLGRVREQDLAVATRTLFVVSTSGEGDAPDSAAGFARRMVPGTTSMTLTNLRFGILALGDSSYANYCAFGHALESWLRRHHAQPLFDTVEVDNGDAGALRHWQHHLGMLSGHHEADWSVPGYGRWRLAQRHLLNPGSQGGPAFHLSLTPLDLPPPVWQAGDIVEVGPRNAASEVRDLIAALALEDGKTGQQELAAALAERQLPRDRAAVDALRGLSAQQLLAQLALLPHREYSIASLPEDGTLDLLVRQISGPDGRLGIGSGWLTQYAEVGGEIALRVRSNSSFHAPAEDISLILIGNGTGLAGLRAHLHARVRADHSRNWLVFGERTQATDYFYREEIQRWQSDGLLQRLDLAFSRDQSERVYVQHRLRAATAELRQWVDDGAAIYVCGSLQGMAAEVNQALQEILGEDMLIALTEQGRYRRDVY